MGAGTFKAQTQTYVAPTTAMETTTTFTPDHAPQHPFFNVSGTPLTPPERFGDDPIRNVIIGAKHNAEAALSRIQIEIQTAQHNLADALARKATLEAQVSKYASFLSNEGGED